MLRTFTILAACSLAVLATSGCGDDSTTTTTTDTGVRTDTAGNETAVPVVNECAATDYIDATTDETKRKVTPWGLDLGKNGCVKIRVGQTVTWDPAPDALHPLGAMGGDTPNPITNTASVTFPTAGVFGFQCNNHPTVMFGAIQVVP